MFIWQPQQPTVSRERVEKKNIYTHTTEKVNWTN